MCMRMETITLSELLAIMLVRRSLYNNLLRGCDSNKDILKCFVFLVIIIFKIVYMFYINSNTL